MGSCSISPSSVYLLSSAAYENRCSSFAADDGYYEDDGFESTPLLPRPRGRRSARTERPRTEQAAATLPQGARRGAPSVAAAAAAVTTVPLPRKVRWHDMAFGSVRVPAAMDMGEIRRRLNARQALAAAGADNKPSAAGWAPWRLIRSLSCKGVEVVAAAAAPVRLV